MEAQVGTVSALRSNAFARLFGFVWSQQRPSGSWQQTRQGDLGPVLRVEEHLDYYESREDAAGRQRFTGEM